MTDKTQKKQRGPGRPWKPGQSGNPAGCPTGSRHKATLAVLALLDGEAETLTRKAVEMALAGDSVAMRLCLERLAPPRKDSPVTLAGLPKIECAADLPKATCAILEAVARGDITPNEGQALAGLLESHRKTLETAEIEQRLSALEARENIR
ncbi:DUF5681 domain-containing protein [Fundidesulfovibrio agrisoli]|uniref:DUF5681 domain-containing protein n=1 Tax=Fundidesulfovibrio agrisoli TaxID=2922717 RepID=UPI001FACCA9F|nr:DUF5681 domain-containing protein [Fundidesulfovibrio agrisoli]